MGIFYLHYCRLSGLNDIGAADSRRSLMNVRGRNFDGHKNNLLVWLRYSKQRMMLISKSVQLLLIPIYEITYSY